MCHDRGHGRAAPASSEHLIRHRLRCTERDETRPTAAGAVSRSTPGAVARVVQSALFFGATHFQPLQFAGLTAAGLVFAAAVVRTGWLGSAIAVHVGFNATTFTALVLL